RKCQAVLLPRTLSARTPAHRGTPAAAATTAARSTGPAAKSTAAHSAATGCARRFFFLAKAKCLAQTEVERKSSRSGRAIYRHQHVSARFVAIEAGVANERCIRKRSLESCERRPV